MAYQYGKMFLENVTDEIHCRWLQEMSRELRSTNGTRRRPPDDDPGLKRHVNDFINDFIELNGAGWLSQEEALETIVSNVRNGIKVDGKNFYFGMFTEMIVDKSFGDVDDYDCPLTKKYLSKIFVPDTCKSSGWRDFDSIYDEHGNLKPEFRTEAEIKIDEMDSAAHRQTAKRKNKGVLSHRFNAAQDLCINPGDSTTIGETLARTSHDDPKSSGFSKDARRQAWWDKLIGPEIRKRICRF